MTRARRIGGWIAVIVGLLVLVGGAGFAVAFGPDNTLSSDPQRLTSESGIIATTPAAISMAGPTVEVTVVAADPDRSVFVGVGRNLDVADYLDGVARLEVDDVSWPWSFAGASVDGRAWPAVDPGDLDWWLTSDHGKGRATVSLPLPDSAIDVVAMDADREGALDATITVGFVLHGAFAGGLAVALVGLGIAAFGWLARSRRAEVGA